MKQLITTERLKELLANTDILLPRQGELLIKKIDTSSGRYYFSDLVDMIARVVIDTPYDHLPVSIQAQLRDIEKGLK